MSEGSDSPEMIIGETHFKPENSDLTQATATEVNTSKLASFKNALTQMLHGAPVPKPDEINTGFVARAIKDQRIETSRFASRDGARIDQKFTTPDILSAMGIKGNYGSDTDWREKHPQEFAAARREMDELVRNGIIEPVENNLGDPNNEVVAYKIVDPNAILELSKTQSGK